jgi:hypothetical protein
MAQKPDHVGFKVGVGETLLGYIERGYGAEFVLADQLVRPSERRNVTGLLRTVLKTWQQEVRHMESAPCESADAIARSLSKVTCLGKLIAHLESSLSKAI